MIGNIVHSRWLSEHPWRRRIMFAVLLLLFAVLALFPKQYRVAASLTPTEPASLGLSGALGQLGAFNNVFGSQAAIEVSLKVARSTDVRRIVIRHTDLVHKLGFSSEDDADRWLAKKVDIRSLRGGIIQMETEVDDRALGTLLISGMADATRDRLAEISRTQTAYKRDVLVNLVRNASQRLDTAQAAYDAFRRRTRYSEPGTSINAIGQRIPAIQAQLKAKEVELRAARSFATDDNMTVRQILAQMDALRAQLREAENLDEADPDSVNRVVVESTEVQDLQRELTIAHTLYDSYRRYLEGTAVEDLTSTANVRVLEPPYVDTARQFRTVPTALFLVILIVALATEAYLMRPPLGARRFHGDLDA